jgi:DNA polymerase-3 subunit delta'
MFMKAIDILYPTWCHLQSRRDRLPHALLLAGPRGLGKLALAQSFAASLLCENPQQDGLACGRCLACGWMVQGNHPDFRLLQPEALAPGDDESEGKAEKKKPSQQITIDQVRALEEFLAVGAHRAGARIVIVHPAEAMNRNTANALLKSLEEPGAGILFLLVSHEPTRLLPTIRSRCQTENVPRPDPGAALSALEKSGVSDPGRWLALAGGAPFLAQELAAKGQGDWIGVLADRLAAPDGDPLGAAADLDRLLKEGKGSPGLREVVEYAQKWVVDLTLATSGLPARYFVLHQATMASMVERLSLRGLVGFHRRLVETRRQVEQPLNSRLFLENLFLEYHGLFANPSRR